MMPWMSEPEFKRKIQLNWQIVLSWSNHFLAWFLLQNLNKWTTFVYETKLLAFTMLFNWNKKKICKYGRTNANSRIQNETELTDCTWFSTLRVLLFDLVFPLKIHQNAQQITFENWIVVRNRTVRNAFEVFWLNNMHKFSYLGRFVVIGIKEWRKR